MTGIAAGPAVAAGNTPDKFRVFGKAGSNSGSPSDVAADVKVYDIQDALTVVPDFEEARDFDLNSIRKQSGDNGHGNNGGETAIAMGRTESTPAVMPIPGWLGSASGSPGSPAARGPAFVVIWLRSRRVRHAAKSRSVSASPERPPAGSPAGPGNAEAMFSPYGLQLGGWCFGADRWEHDLDGCFLRAVPDKDGIVNLTDRSGQAGKDQNGDGKFDARSDAWHREGGSVNAHETREGKSSELNGRTAEQQKFLLGTTFKSGRRGTDDHGKYAPARRPGRTGRERQRGRLGRWRDPGHDVAAGKLPSMAFTIPLEDRLAA